MKLPDHPSLNNEIGFLLLKLGMASRDRFIELAGSHGVHPRDYGMLLIIESEEPISQQELSRRTGIDPSTMVARMDALVERGLVERTRSEVDRRVYEIRLSNAGRKLLPELRTLAREHGERFFSALSDSERKQLQALLIKLAASLPETG